MNNLLNFKIYSSSEIHKQYDTDKSLTDSYINYNPSSFAGGKAKSQTKSKGKAKSQTKSKSKKVKK